ncbi:hypothetical protein Mal4_24490 [Maioricimonas rarisocia]|uniref:Uncharacterized protein n=1 Tax=Maioricimonas rarisocia TaxID=2528026 RepID=A0A517Z6M4_9PLAN|nr:hypothetical protein [Maioricimonas rarisocia]QDU38127.1 hypothetical protein Mal4_24490 [Maioricimonas rarisocia]
MDVLTRAQLLELAPVQEGPHVSLYLKTFRSAPDSHQNPIRLKNLLAEASDQLESLGYDQGDIRPLLQPASELLDHDRFWTHQADGLAIFLARDFVRIYQTGQSFEDEVVVDDSFRVTPLIPATQPSGHYYVIAVSPDSCRFFEGSKFGLHERTLDDLPENVDQALQRERERELNFHSMQPRPQADAQHDTAMYHGHEENALEIDMAAYMRIVRDAIHPVVYQSHAPLIFAGTEEAFASFRENANDLPSLHGTAADGNPDRLSANELHEKTWPIAEEILRSKELQPLSEYEARAAANSATDRLDLILPAAGDGLIDTLVLQRGASCPGDYDVNERTLRHNDENGAELLNLAARLTLQSGGEVVVVDEDTMKDRWAAAVLRCPTSAIALPV